MKLSGYRSRVQVISAGAPNGVWLGVADWSFSDEVEEHDLSNSEGYLGHGLGDGADDPLLGEGTEAHLYSSVSPAQPVARIELSQATFNTENNPLAPAPGLALRAGRGVKIRIWPDRDAERRHYFPAMLVTATRGAGQVKGLQPFSLVCRSDGPYFLWSNL